MSAFEKSIRSSPPNGWQSTAEKVCGLPAFKKSIWFPPQMAGNQPRRFKVAAACLPSRSPFGLPLQMASNQPLRRFAACLPSKSLIGFPPQWPAISREGLKWPLHAHLWEVHLVFSSNGQQSTAKKVCGSPAFKKSIWFHPQIASNQPRRYKSAAACPPLRSPFGLSPRMAGDQPPRRSVARLPSKSPLVSPPNGRQSAKKV